MSSHDHADFAALLDYWLEEPANEALEEHLFSCGECHERLAGIVALGAGVRRAFQDGLIHVFVPAEFVARLAKQGLRIREYRIPVNGSVNCTVTPDDDWLVTYLELPRERYARLDAIFDTGDGQKSTFQDLPYDAESGVIIDAPPMTRLRAMPSGRRTLQVFATDDKGSRLISEYTFSHTRHAPS